MERSPEPAKQPTGEGGKRENDPISKAKPAGEESLAMYGAEGNREGCRSCTKPRWRRVRDVLHARCLGRRKAERKGQIKTHNVKRLSKDTDLGERGRRAQCT